MSRIILPQNEDVWETIKTKNEFEFVITHDIINKKYILYRKVNSHYNKMSSSTDAIDLLKEISKYEKQTFEICGRFACVYAVKDGCIIEGWNDAEGKLNGKKSFCPIYNVQCIHAKCKYCGRNYKDCLLETED